MIWTCDECGGPGAAVVVLRNANPSAGRVGAAPVHPDWNRVAVLHLDCDPHRRGGGYVIEVERATTPNEWLGWAAHLADKPWMGPNDLRAFLHLWEKQHGPAGSCVVHSNE